MPDAPCQQSFRLLIPSPFPPQTEWEDPYRKKAERSRRPGELTNTSLKEKSPPSPAVRSPQANARSIGLPSVSNQPIPATPQNMFHRRRTCPTPEVHELLRVARRSAAGGTPLSGGILQ